MEFGDAAGSVEEDHVLAAVGAPFDAGESADLVVGTGLDARGERGIGASAPGADAEADRLGDFHLLRIGGDGQIGDGVFTPVPLDGEERGAIPHVPVALEEGFTELPEGTLILGERHLKRDVQQASRLAEAVVVAAELDYAELASGRPITFETFEDVEAADDRLAPDMQGGLMPGAELSAHVDKFWFLKLGHARPTPRESNGTALDSRWVQLRRMTIKIPAVRVHASGPAAKTFG